jgi:hypothetical protein
MLKNNPESPREFRKYCQELWKTDKNYKEYFQNFRRLVCLVIFFLIVICGLNVWLFYKG